MKSSVWSKALKNCADPQRARHYRDLLATTTAAKTLASVSAEQARILCALFSGSQALSGWLIVHPELLVNLTLELLQHPCQPQGLKRELAGWLTTLSDVATHPAAFERLRQFKQREMLRIGARDLARLANVREITLELSNVADVCLDAVLQLCAAQLNARLGRPYHQDAKGRWQRTGFCVLGLGKLGGRELNYSSDVDVVFLYEEEGQVYKQPPGRAKKVAVAGPASHQYFNRLAEMFIAEVSRMTADGMLYRMDMRLRPEGDAGPLTRSLAGYENYYAQWGQTWERMMLIKARGVAGDGALAAEFLEMIHPFRYPRSPGGGVLREVAAMKERIENEVVKAGELDRNVKLGRGGIREIEFVAQTLQLIHAGRQPFLQGPQTLPTLEKLAQYELLSRDEARSLTDSYCFLRDVEHRLQMEDNRQTHTIPEASAARQRLAALMGFATTTDFENARREHTRAVREVYDRLLKADAPAQPSALPAQITGAETEWKRILAEHAFINVGHSLRLLTEFVHGPGYVHVSSRTVELASQLLPKMFALCPGASGPLPANVLSDPDRVLTRLDQFVSAYGARATLFEMWNSNPSLFELMLLLFDRSEFLAEAAIRTPDLVDALVLGGRLRRGKDAAEILKDLRHGRDDPDQRLWLRRYHQAELMRIGLRDILGLAGFEQNLTELSALADACLQYALEVILRKHKLKSPPLVIIGLGKLGGAEINYGSDLDIIFVTAAPARSLPKLQALAVEVMDLISSRTESGMAFATDARLRPDGEKGLLVNTLEACEVYYRRRAQLWEIQSLSRTRPVAGDLKLGNQFQKLAGVLTNFTAANVRAKFELRRDRPARGPGLPAGLSAYSPKWKQEIRRMRARIETERTPPGQDALAIKTGAGGLMDAEFLAQTFCLAHGWQEPNTLRALERARDADALSGLDADKLIESYRRLRRVEGILRRWSFEGETVLPAEDAPFYRVAIRCGFGSPKEFRAALAKWRRDVRSVYNKTVCE
jgi:[glutamine synthetase] adenylyltransferase / [glutamine synthetase]-adenylyl-L-tyrosine phosphorylase